MRYMTLGEALNLSEEFSLLICKAGIKTYAFEATVTDHCAVTQRDTRIFLQRHHCMFPECEMKRMGGLEQLDVHITADHLIFATG